MQIGKRGFLSIALIANLLLFSGCGDSHQNDDYGITDVNKIALTVDNHPHGYGRSQCFTCHLPDNIHQENRVNSFLVDTARDLVKTEGTNRCYACHGTNGL